MVAALMEKKETQINIFLKNIINWKVGAVCLRGKMPGDRWVPHVVLCLDMSHAASSLYIYIYIYLYLYLKQN